MIIKNGDNEKIEKLKQRAGLTGDVYLYNEHFMESLESHKKLYPNSKATNIEEAYIERVEYENAKLQEIQNQAKENIEEG